MDRLKILPLWGRWQGVALTEGVRAPEGYTPSTMLRMVPLPQWGRI